MSKTVRTWLGGAFAIVLLLVGAFGCAGQPAPTPAPAKPAAPAQGAPAPAANKENKVVIRAARLTTSGAGIPYDTIEKLDLAKKHGVDLQIVDFTNPAEEEVALVGNKLDVVSIDVVSMATMRLKGTDVRVIHPALWSYSSLIVPNDSPIKEVADLKGRDLGIYSNLGASTPILIELLKAKGIDYKNEVKIHVSPPAVLPELLKKGDVEAIDIWEPFRSQLLATGKYREVIQYADWYKQRTGSNWLWVGVGIRGELCEKYPEAVGNFLKMYKEAVSYVKANPDKVMDEWTASHKVTDAATIALLKKSMVGALANDFDDEIIKDQNDYMQLSVASGMLSKIPEGLFTLAFMPK